jgi:hypothetical protein
VRKGEREEREWGTNNKKLTCTLNVVGKMQPAAKMMNSTLKDKLSICAVQHVSMSQCKNCVRISGYAGFPCHNLMAICMHAKKSNVVMCARYIHIDGHVDATIHCCSG